MNSAGSVDEGDGSGTTTCRIRSFVADPALPHLQLNSSKSLTSRPAQAGLDLDPIQRLSQMAWRPSGLPGQNDRRYRNGRAAWRPGPHATRSPARPLSPEGRSGSPGVRVSVYPVVGGWVRGVPHHPTPPTHPRVHRSPHPGLPEWPSGLNGLAGRAVREYREYREHTGIPG